MSDVIIEENNSSIVTSKRNIVRLGTRSHKSKFHKNNSAVNERKPRSKRCYKMRELKKQMSNPVRITDFKSESPQRPSTISKLNLSQVMRSNDNKNTK